MIVSSAESRFFYFVGCQRPTFSFFLFRSDGTRTGTSVLHEENGATLSWPNGLTFFQGKLYFTAYYDDEHSALWSTDGTSEGTTLVTPVHEASDDRRSAIQATPSRLFFSSGEGAEDLWVTDGIPGHERFLADLEPPSCYPPPERYCDPPDLSSMFALGEEVYFINRPADRAVEIWSSDGTESGTGPVLQFSPGLIPGRPIRLGGRWRCAGFRRILGSLGGKTFFAALPQAGSTVLDELWVTDGTPEGTHRVTGHVDELGFLGGLAYFGTGGYETSRSQIWSTDGSAAGTQPLTTLRSVARGSNVIFHALGQGAVLQANDGSRDALWTSDGTPEGTRRFFDFPPGAPRSFWYPAWVRVGNLQFFSVIAGTGNKARGEQWRTDGTASGTGRIAVLPRQALPSLQIGWNGKFLFQTQFLNGKGCSFWSSDGTAAGTREILPAPPGRRCATAALGLGSQFLFVARVEGPDGPAPQIFASNGTPEGTRQITRIRSRREAFGFDQPVAVGNTAFFLILKPHRRGVSEDWEIWRSDGTPGGTYPASNLKGTSDLYGFRGSLYLTAAVSSGRGFFRLPLHGGDPVLLTYPGPFYGSSHLPEFTPLGDHLLFVAYDRAHGTELWTTDGTPEGTRLLRDIKPGPMSSDPTGLTSAGDRVFFFAGDGEHGIEAWESDGTPEGTRLAWDLDPGGYSSSASGFTVSGGNLFFGASDGETGFEPWAVPVSSAKPSTATRTAWPGRRSPP